MSAEGFSFSPASGILRAAGGFWLTVRRWDAEAGR